MSKATTVKPAAPVKRPGVGNDTTAFRSEHDNVYKIPRKIQAALDQLGESWVYESKFLQLAGLQGSQLKEYREQFQDYIVIEPRSERDRRVWAGTVAYANELKGFHNE